MAKGVFFFQEQDLVNKEDGENSNNDFYEYDDSYIFRFGIREGDYYRINNETLYIENDLFINVGIDITYKQFYAERGGSIFKRIDQLCKEPIYIGGNKETAIPIKEFEELIKIFPNSTELKHYVSSKVSMVLSDYLETMTDAQKIFSNYLAKKKKTPKPFPAPNK